MTYFVHKMYGLHDVVALELAISILRKQNWENRKNLPEVSDNALILL